MDLRKFRKLPLIGIIRGIKPEQLRPALSAAFEAGLVSVEITMDTPNAADLIRAASKAFSGKMSIGAGTVLDVKTLKTALSSGATFIVTPVPAPEVALFCAKREIPVFPGAFTPAEILSAWNSGATMVKVYPAWAFGPKYIKDLKTGPLSKVEMMAVGGVTPENAAYYFAAGASAIACGGHVFRKRWMDNGDFKPVKKTAAAYVEAVRQALSLYLAKT